METPTPRFIEIRSEEIQELITRPPAWLLRWGITLVFFVLCTLATGAWFIHYPDIVRAPFTLTSVNAPKPVLTRTEGRLAKLMVHESMFVQAGDSLAYMESTASHAEVLALARELRKAWQFGSSGNLAALERLHLANYHRLGELQTAYQTFEQARIKLRAYAVHSYYDREKRLLQQELADAQKMAGNLQRQRQLQAQDVQLAQADFDAQRQLAQQKVIPPLELMREESKAIARKLPYNQTSMAIITNLASQRAKQREILALDKVASEQRDTFLQALNTLQSAVDAWLAKYVVCAPEAGQVFFSKLVEVNQPLIQNEELFYISPPAVNHFGLIRVPQQSAGKVAPGQTVLIKFAAYPYQEYGVVHGRIASIAEVPAKDSAFIAKVSLPHGLTTTSGRHLTYKTGITASAEIVTNDKRLLEKMFDQLRGLFAR